MSAIKLLIMFCLFLTSCSKSSDSTKWASTTATLIDVEHFAEDKNNPYTYTITYSATESRAVRKDGTLIQGPITQYVADDRRPIKGQKVTIQYQKDEPILFKFIDPIQYEPLD